MDNAPRRPVPHSPRRPGTPDRNAARNAQTLCPKSSRLFGITRGRPRDPRRRRLRPRQIDRRLLLDLLLPRDPGVPVQPEGAEDVEDDERPHDPKVAPSGRVLRAELCQVDVGAASSAKLTVRCGVVVGEVTTTYCVDIGGHVLAACLARRRVELDEFNGRADDDVVGQTGGQHAVNEVCEGRYAVHEYPEARESGGSGEDTGRVVSNESQGGGGRLRGLPAEDQGQGEEQLGNIPGGLCRIDTSYDHVGEG